MGIMGLGGDRNTKHTYQQANMHVDTRKDDRLKRHAFQTSFFKLIVSKRTHLHACAVSV